MRPLIARGRSAVIYSSAGVGKSLLALEIAACLAAGRPLLGQPVKPHRVVYVDFENDPYADILSRLLDLDFSPEELANLSYYSFPDMAKFDTEAGGRELHAIAQQDQADLVIIDTVSRTVQGDENENDTWLDFYIHTGLLLKRSRIACLRLDHSGKDASKGQRGGSAKEGDVDSIWRLDRLQGLTFQLVNEKMRGTLDDHDQKLTLQREADPLRHVLATDPRRAARAVRVSDLMDTLDQLAVPRDAGRPTAQRALKQHGTTFTSSELAEAIRVRKSCTNSSRTADQPHLSATPTNTPAEGSAA